jgi:hypothetical protein
VIQYDTDSQNRYIKIPNPGTWVLLPEDARNNSARYDYADKYLYSLTSASGGELYLAEAGSSLKEVFAGIADDLELQYTLCYYPRSQNPDGSLHRIRVEIDRPGVKIRARSRYRTAETSAAGK